MRESECSDIGGSLDAAHAEGKLIQFYRKIHCLTSELSPRWISREKPVSHESQSDECDFDFSSEI